MVTRFDRDYKQSFDEVEKEFPNCKLLMILNNIKDKEGYLIAISDSPETSMELGEIQCSFKEKTIFHVGGWYADDMSVGIINIAEKK